MRKLAVALILMLYVLPIVPAFCAESTPEAAPAAAPAAEAAPPKVDTGDTAWILASSALVMLMTPGLGLFYAGMARRKNVIGTLMHSFIALGIVTIQWMLFGYSLAFGPDVGSVIGNLSWFALNSVGLEPNADYAATIPHQVFKIGRAHV